jgi:hypothetical protein
MLPGNGQQICGGGGERVVISFGFYQAEQLNLLSKFHNPVKVNRSSKLDLNQVSINN